MPNPESIACIGLGSNIEPRHERILAAIEALRHLPGIQVQAVSSLHETDPVGPVPQGRYVNAAAVLRTALSPHALLEALLAVERSLGRDRSDGLRWGPRTIDLDLLIVGSVQLHEPKLTIPHPHLAERAFVLEPLAEIVPNQLVPGIDRTVRELLNDLRGAMECSPGASP